jgi:hypothetical protein
MSHMTPHDMVGGSEGDGRVVGMSWSRPHSRLDIMYKIHRSKTTKRHHTSNIRRWWLPVTYILLPISVPISFSGSRVHG